MHMDALEHVATCGIIGENAAARGLSFQSDTCAGKRSREEPGLCVLDEVLKPTGRGFHEHAMTFTCGTLLRPDESCQIVCSSL
jgi:hypothetical protein